MTELSERNRAFHRGVRASIAWLHQHATTMNDPHARAILNTAAHGLGVDKPNPRAEPPPSYDGSKSLGERLHAAVNSEGIGGDPWGALDIRTRARYERIALSFTARLSDEKEDGR